MDKQICYDEALLEKQKEKYLMRINYVLSLLNDMVEEVEDLKRDINYEL